MIKSTLQYSISEDKTEINIVYSTESYYSAEIIEKHYKIKDKSNGELYNEMLDDLDGEYDHIISSLVEKIVDKIFKEVEKDEI